MMTRSDEEGGGEERGKREYIGGNDNTDEIRYRSDDRCGSR
jgi:hypothetical protein